MRCERKHKKGVHGGNMVSPVMNILITPTSEGSRNGNR
jgi:hypothetical protein